jgi:hypothetical protein
MDLLSGCVFFLAVAALVLGAAVDVAKGMNKSFVEFMNRIGKGINPARARALYDKLSKGERDAIADEATFVETEAWIKENKQQ